MEDKNTTVKKESVPIWEKYALTIYEAAEYFNIGEHRLRQLVRENRQADFVLWIGTKVEIIRDIFAVRLGLYQPRTAPRPGRARG